MNAPPLVLLPGWGHNPAVFDPLRAHMGSHATLSFDLPGRSAKRRVPTPRFELRAPSSLRKNFIRSLVDPELEARCWPNAVIAKLPPVCDLLGWSLGGLLAMSIALAAPQRLRRLVLVATTPCFLCRRGWRHGMRRADFEDFCWRLAQDPAAALQYFQGLEACGDNHERAVLRALRASQRGATPDPVALRAGLDLLRDTDLRSRAAHIRVPTLVIHGTQDGLVPPAAGAWLARRIPSAKLLALTDAGHAPFLSEPSAFSGDLREFLSAA
jgi:pimeloyl-[acyl-carrier protein] methyl ester esterase